MNLKCCISSCQEVKSSIIQLHPFPIDPILKQKWLNAIKKESFIPKRNHRVCSKHFKKIDYVKKRNNFVLNHDAIPWFIRNPLDTNNQVDSTNIDDIERFIRSVVTEEWIVNEIYNLLKNIINMDNIHNINGLKHLIQSIRSTYLNIQIYKNILNDLKNHNI